jgi:ABC-type transport system substrate-binding protein
LAPESRRAVSVPRALFLALPAVLLAVLAQSVLWVPSYRSQGSDNPARLTTFVEASIGDARLLNPILSADTASSRIVDLSFDGLLRVGEDLTLQGALAERWAVSERAYLALADGRDPQPVMHTIETALNRVDAALLSAPLRVLPTHTREVLLESASPPGVRVRVRVPRRIELRLSRVVADLESILLDALAEPLDADLDPALRVDAGDVPLTAAQSRELVPALEHNPEITFWLRRGVRFHDGQPFSAHDVEFTYRAIMDPRNLSPRRASFEPVKDVTVLDEHRVRVSYKRLFSPAVAAWTMGILPRHLLDVRAMNQEMDRRGVSGSARESFGIRDSEFNRRPVGTGAFRFVEWASDELIHLERNDDYHAGAALYRSYYFRILPDNLVQELEFRAGAIDSYQAEPHQAERYRTDPRYRAFSAVSPGYTYIGYNLRKEPFSDPRVRRALGMAIDVQSIIRHVLYGEGERVTGPYASVTDWYDRSVPALPYDPAAAQALLAEAGYVRGADGWLTRNGARLEFTLITNNGNLRRKAVATIVQQAWRQIGVKCNVQLFEWAVFLKDFVNPGQFDAVVLGWQLGLDPDLFQLWHSTQSGPNELNFVGYRDPHADELIEAIRREYDRDAQRRLAHRLHARIAQLQPYTFLFAPRVTRLLDRKIVMRAPDGTAEPVRAGGAGDLFFHLNRWQRLAHDPGF